MTETMVAVKENCGNCKFWVRMEEDVGECREDIPQMLLVPQQSPIINKDSLLTGGPVKQQVQLSPMSFFPPVHSGKWCGKFKQA